MRTIAVGITAFALAAAGSLVIPSLSHAADGTGVYDTVVQDPSGSRAALTFAGTTFPRVAVDETDSKLGAAKSATLGANTPFGESFGASTGKSYLTVGLDAGKPKGKVTLTFDVPPVPGTYGIALGDVDAEEIIITALGPDGQPVSTREWLGTTFNYAGASDQPRWDASTGTIRGNGRDTQGASLYFVPSDNVKSISFEQVRTSGFPEYQLWLAADVITSSAAHKPEPTKTAVPAAPTGLVTICHRTSSKNNPYVEITVNHNSIDGKNGHDTHTGGLYPTSHWGDIIPPFYGYSGKNWPAGASILANGCDVGTEELIPAALITSLSASASASAIPSASASTSASTTASASASPSSSASSSASSSLSASASASASATASATENCTTTKTGLVNGDFEEPVIPAKSYRQIKDGLVPGWTTTASDALIEIWSSGFNGVASPDGEQFAELNATQDSELYQDVATVPGQKLTWSLYHRARGAGASGDTMSVNIGAVGAAPNLVTTLNDALPAGWVLHTGTYTVPAGQTRTQFGFKSGATASGNKSIGNFLDHIFFEQTACLPADALKPPTVTPSASASASAPTTMPTPLPTPDKTAATPDKPVIVDPTTPTTIDATDLGDKDPGAVITNVVDPPNGTVELKNGALIYTPDPGFHGTENVTVFIEAKDGTITKESFVVKVGKPADPCTTLPDTLHFGDNTLPHGGAGCQQVRVSARCSLLARSLPADGVAFCYVMMVNGRLVIHIMGGQPLGARVTITGPSSANRPKVSLSRVYFVRG